MIRRVLTWPKDQATLHSKSEPVAGDEFEADDLRVLIQDMWDTLYDAGGVGLAAIQIGVRSRVVVMDSGKYGKRWVLINPIVLGHKGRLTQTNEGCLSIPGIVELMFRHPTVVVQAYDETGNVFEHEFQGLEAQCVQHEIDHCDGVLMTDAFPENHRAKLAKRLKEKK